MTTTSQSSTTSESSGTSSSSGGDVEKKGSSALESSQGKTSIASSVVAKIAGMAAREVSGVYRMGGGAARAFGAIRERLPGSTSSSTVTQGVAVEVGERQAAIDIDVVIEYGVSIVDLAQSIRRNVISSIEGMTGLEVTEVNISVDDVHLPGDDDQQQQRSEPEPARVQ